MIPGVIECGLLPTVSHRRRGYSISRSEGGSGEGDWKIEIWQGKESKAYYLEEQPAVGFIGRRFLWLKVEDGEVYETHVGADFIQWKCTCTAGCVGRFLCKHAEVLFDAIHKSLLEKHNATN